MEQIHQDQAEGQRHRRGVEGDMQVGRRWRASVAMGRVRDLGRRRWKAFVGYHRRSLVERAVSRLEGTFGDRLKNRVFATERTEIRLRCEILSRFTQLGLPRFEWV